MSNRLIHLAIIKHFGILSQHIWFEILRQQDFRTPWCQVNRLPKLLLVVAPCLLYCVLEREKKEKSLCLKTN